MASCYKKGQNRNLKRTKVVTIPNLVWMLKAGLHNKVKPTREETSYPVVIAQPITATLKPPTTSKYQVLGGGEQGRVSLQTHEHWENAKNQIQHN